MVLIVGQSGTISVLQRSRSECRGTDGWGSERGSSGMSPLCLWWSPFTSIKSYDTSMGTGQWFVRSSTTYLDSVMFSTCMVECSIRNGIARSHCGPGCSRVFYQPKEWSR
jgi:hypothetical protein